MLGTDAVEDLPFTSYSGTGRCVGDVGPPLSCWAGWDSLDCILFWGWCR